MSEKRELRGVGVSPGLVIAPALRVHWEFPSVPDRTVEPEEVDNEIARLHDAVSQVVDHLSALHRRTLHRAGPEEAGIFDAQILMARDETFLAGVETLIRKNNLSAETAYEFKALELRNAWQRSDVSVLRDRLADVNAIHFRMLVQLMGTTSDESWVGEIRDQVILIATELAPGMIVQLDREHVSGIVSEEGTRTSHAAILAHSLGIPAVMGVSGAMNEIEDGTLVLIDGQTGQVVVDPTHDELELARLQATRRAKLDLQLEGMAGEPAQTPDGHRVALFGNIDLPEEVEPAVRFGADGVGLLRTEFLVTGRTAMPSEDEQTEYYRRVGAAFAGKPVVVRTYDLGGDKFPAAFSAPHEANPFLGWRSIRVCLDRPEIFRPQLRALLRAAADRNIHVMLPMVIAIEELRQVREMVSAEAEALRNSGVRAAGGLRLGVMVETPAAVMLADAFADEADFLSVGSNDLTQYTLAVDRGNARLADRFAPLHPAVVRQLALVQRAAARTGISASVCGEMGSDPLAVVLLLGLGYDRLSVAPPSLPMVKWIIRHVPHAEAVAAAEAACAATDMGGVSRPLREALGKYLDLRLVDPAGALPRVSGTASLPHRS
ncbi:MAG TPA: phosphoenolpyruvate--protein phosphotransferase [Gemmatimonadales bacterium]|nr:phosphoenolpyruvate--protein phosphotransferase [Gemmatimonadales bacterium]